jgi:endonuclease G
MKIQKLHIYIFLLLLSNNLFFAQQTAKPTIKHLEIPAHKSNDAIIEHFAYTLSYNEKYEQANWVAYELTVAETNSIIKRGNNFITDPLVSTQSANNNDYSESGFDRGHLAPAGDMGWSIKAMEESFYYSNMSPQVPSFNRGIWKRTEELVRDWAKQYLSIYVVTGPIFGDSLTTIGTNKVAVPKYYYKVILDYNHNHTKGIGFIMPNSGSKNDIESYAVTIDSVEKVTGIDFFHNLPEDDERLIEGHIKIDAWSWTHTKKSTTYDDKLDNTKLDGDQQTQEHKSNDNVNKDLHDSPKNATSVQCSGKTKKGIRCKNVTKNVNGRCHLH